MSELSTKISTGGQRQSMARAHASFFTAQLPTLAARVASRPRRRAFALYLLTISIGMLLTATALTLITMQRAERRLQENIAHTDELRGCARAGLEMAVAFTEQVSDWRTRAAGSSGKLFEDFAVGDGKVTAQVFDDLDAQLANDETQVVRLRVTAQRDSSKVYFEAQLSPRAHPALGYACFGTTNADMTFLGMAEIRGPVRSHGQIVAAAGNKLSDDPSFETMTGYTIGDPLAPKAYVTTAIAAPQPDLSVYTARATAVVGGDNGGRYELIGRNLVPAGANAAGIYWLDAGGREVRIEDLHLKGTLIITNTGGNKVEFHKGFFLEPGPYLYPVLLVDCPLNYVLIDPDASLRENSLETSGVDLNGDGDVNDMIASRSRGVIWSNSVYLTVSGTPWRFAGSLINKAITVDSGIIVDNDLTLLSTFSPGFVQTGMSILPGSVHEVWP